MLCSLFLLSNMFPSGVRLCSYVCVCRCINIMKNTFFFRPFVAPMLLSFPLNVEENNGLRIVQSVVSDQLSLDEALICGQSPMLYFILPVWCIV